MPLTLLLDGLIKRRRRPHLTTPDTLKPQYDVIIIGGGGHGLAIAYHLAKDHGITHTVVLEKGYLGGGNTARNTAVIRSNYLTEESIRFYRESQKLYRALSTELDYNILYSERGQLTLAHTDAAIRNFRWRAEVNKHLGVRSELIDREEIRRRVPTLDLSENTRYPILAGLWHADGATARHDAVAWAYAKAATTLGVEIHPQTEVTGIIINNGVAQGVRTPRGDIHSGVIIQAVAGDSSRVAALAGIRLPIITHPLQAMVTQPLKPFLDPHVSSSHLHCYVHQTARGEIVIGGGADPYPLYSTRSTHDLKEQLLSAAVEMFPFLSEVKLLRQWAGSTDMTPDYSPIMGDSPIKNYHLDAGWGTWGFKATPIVGKTMAAHIAHNRPPPLIAPFALSRFTDFAQINERGATAASH